MSDREWISQEKMFWTKQEWDEAYTSVYQSCNFDSLNSTDKMTKLIGYLMHEYPVSMAQLRDAKQRHGHV